MGGHAIGNAVFGTDLAGLIDLPRCDSMARPMATATSRSLPWDGNNDRAAVALPANVHYQAGSGDQLVVKGDPDLIAHIRVHDGLVSLDCNGNFHFGRDNRTDVTLPGRRTFKSFALLGTGNVQLGGLSQPEVKVSIAGAGDHSGRRQDGQSEGGCQRIGQSEAGRPRRQECRCRYQGQRKGGSRTAGFPDRGSWRDRALFICAANPGKSRPRSAAAAPSSIRTAHGRVDGRASGMRAPTTPRSALPFWKRWTMTSDVDRDGMERAREKLKGRIRARVAHELEREDNL